MSGSADGNLPMRVAIDIDSTLHDYWRILARIARDRYGVDLRYEEQRDWQISALAGDALVHCVEESHSDENVLSAEPYPQAVETVRAWKQRGHWIQITSHRRESARLATAQWLERIGLPYDDLHCSFDKVTRCVELGVELLIDDSPVNLVRAHEAGIRVATLLHPWNEEVVETFGFTAARDWRELRAKLADLLE
ncbi:5' nucleotidase, NT5C type [Thermoleophilum album]|uniref:Nucleotidase n=1 Tax=Thermoleophilum album TaxID=29539 RepID=A0A1H6FXT1_THEAL|nr:hypothetical protein [Thermoleophilum album]SEH15090.1 hypothetical protein SAMN02745716_1839 [Thermoleophilum album]